LPHPYFFEGSGLADLSRTLLALAIGCAGLAGTLIAGLGCWAAAGYGRTPARLWLGKCSGEPVIELNPRGSRPARQELILSAHYDSKTELLDHRQRMFFLRNLHFGILLTVLLGVLGPLEHLLAQQGSPLAGVAFLLGVLLTVPLLVLAWGLGLNLSTGRLLKPSQGAVDNGAACAILLELADRLNRQLRLASSSPDFRSPFQQTRVTLAIFAGEEVNMQGSRAYVRQRDYPLPAVALNLEVMAQDGEYVLWEQDGGVFGLSATSAGLNQLVAGAVSGVTGQAPRLAGPVISDGGSFLAVGIPATTLGTYDSRLADTGFHRPTDNLERVVVEGSGSCRDSSFRSSRTYDSNESRRTRRITNKNPLKFSSLSSCSSWILLQRGFMTTIHLVSHTRDREWYLPFQVFRLKLVHMVDGLLDLMGQSRIPLLYARRADHRAGRLS
jgi:hypothetical protein